MLCFLDYRYENEDGLLNFLPHSGGYELDEISCTDDAAVSPEHVKYAGFVADEVKKAFSGLSRHFEFSNFIGYVDIYTRVEGTLDQYIIELSRGGKMKVRYGPRRPSVRFYNYLSDGTKLEVELVMGLTDTGRHCEKDDVEKFEILLEMRVIKSVMESLRKMPPDQASLAHKARVDTACNVIEAFPKDEARCLTEFFRFLESYGFKSYDADEHEAERIVHERLAGRQAVEVTESLGGD